MECTATSHTNYCLPCHIEICQSPGMPFGNRYQSTRDHGLGPFKHGRSSPPAKGLSVYYTSIACVKPTILLIDPLVLPVELICRSCSRSTSAYYEEASWEIGYRGFPPPLAGLARQLYVSHQCCWSYQVIMKWCHFMLPDCSPVAPNWVRNIWLYSALLYIDVVKSSLGHPCPSTPYLLLIQDTPPKVQNEQCGTSS